MQKDLLSLDGMTSADFNQILSLAMEYKRVRNSANAPKPLNGKSIGMIFAKSSTRTHISFDVGIHELGGHPLYLDQSKLQIGRGENLHDSAKVMSRYLHGIIIRTFAHEDVVELAKNATIPVINALTDCFHPCQVLADFLTILESSGKFTGVKMAYVGDGACNMPNSLILGAKLAGIDLVIGSPKAYQPNLKLGDGWTGPGSVSWEEDPQKAVENADYIYTDVWVSMGCEAEAEERKKLLSPYQVNRNLLTRAKKNAKILHCLPAHRGEEITDDIVDCDQSIVFDEAENRLHAQKAVMSLLMGNH